MEERLTKTQYGDIIDIVSGTIKGSGDSSDSSSDKAPLYSQNLVEEAEDTYNTVKGILSFGSVDHETNL